jgi:nucleotide-binding universal stress UspA family protein
MKYLIAIDDSSASNTVFNTVDVLMNKEQDELYIMSVCENYPPYYALSMIPEMVHLAEKKAEQHTRTNLLHFAEKAKKLGIKYHLLMGKSHHVGEVVCKAVDKKAIDFLVVGRRGMGAVKRTLLGSTSRYLLEHANCDVVICKTEMGPEEQHESSLEEIKDAEEREKERRIRENEVAELREARESREARAKAAKLEEEERVRRIKEEMEKIAKEEEQRKEDVHKVEEMEEEERARRLKEHYGIEYVEMPGLPL